MAGKFRNFDLNLSPAEQVGNQRVSYKDKGKMHVSGESSFKPSQDVDTTLTLGPRQSLAAQPAAEPDTASKRIQCLELFPMGNSSHNIVRNTRMWQRLPANVGRTIHEHRQWEIAMFQHLNKNSPFAPKEAVDGRKRKVKEEAAEKAESSWLKLSLFEVGSSSAVPLSEGNCRDEVCAVNRNPAEFKFRGARRVYMVRQRRKNVKRALKDM